MNYKDCNYKNCIFVNLDYIYSNIRYLEEKTKLKAIPVIKSDGYGLGSKETGKFLEHKGYNLFAVASIEEALELRESGIKSEILILSGTPDDSIKLIVKNNFIPVLHSFEQYKSWKRDIPENFKIHIKFNTGMNRLGFNTNENIDNILNDKRLIISGIMTHYAKADSNRRFTLNQLIKFKQLLKKYNINQNKTIIHTSNSASVINNYGVYGNYFRPGIFIYGGRPNTKMRQNPNQKIPYHWVAKIIAMRNIHKGDKISYGGTYIADKNMKIGIIGIGYGDGLPRSLSNRGFFLFNNEKLNIIGRVCMDMTIVDMTNLSQIKVGEFVTVMGNSNKNIIYADDIAKINKTISYEILTGITKRTKRIYSANDKHNK